jgi:hypothetical protein
MLILCLQELGNHWHSHSDVVGHEAVPPTPLHDPGSKMVSVCSQLRVDFDNYRKDSCDRSEFPSLSAPLLSAHEHAALNPDDCEEPGV